MDSTIETGRRRPPASIVALSAFFVFGAVMSGLTCIVLLFPDSEFDALWRLNPDAGVALRSMGNWAIALMLAVSLACALTARGLWILAPWGRRLAIGVFIVNLTGDLANAVLRGDMRTLIGLPIGGGLILWLLTARVKRLFNQPGSRP